MKPVSVQILINNRSLENATNCIISAAQSWKELTFSSRFEAFVNDESNKGGFKLASLIRQQIDIPPGRWCMDVDSSKAITLHAALLLDRTITLIVGCVDLNEETHQRLNAIVTRLMDAGLVINTPLIPVLEQVS